MSCFLLLPIFFAPVQNQSEMSWRVYHQVRAKVVAVKNEHYYWCNWIGSNAIEYYIADWFSSHTDGVNRYSGLSVTLIPTPALISTICFWKKSTKNKSLFKINVIFGQILQLVQNLSKITYWITVARYLRENFPHCRCNYWSHQRISSMERTNGIITNFTNLSSVLLWFIYLIAKTLSCPSNIDNMQVYYLNKAHQKKPFN